MISINIGKAFDNSQYSFKIKTLKNIEIGRNFPDKVAMKALLYLLVKG